LNATEVDEAIDLIRTVNARGVTLIIVEHLMKAIMSVSTSVVVLAEGKKIAEGLPHEVVASPEVIKAYLGTRFAERQMQLDEIKREVQLAREVEPGAHA